MKKTSVEISDVLPVLLASAGHLSARAQRQKGGTPLDRCVGSEVQTCRSGDIFGSKEARRGSSGLRGGDAVAHPADQKETANRGDEFLCTKYIVMARAKRERVVQDGVEKANRRHGPARPGTPHSLFEN